jgi:diacylglycerol kinase (ATP)
MALMRPAVVLLNPQAAGGRAAQLAEPVRRWLAANAPGVVLIEGDSIARSRAALQLLPVGMRVVLLGGDGSLHHMLPALLTHRHQLGLVPLGSGNDTARALGLHRLSWEVALAHALHGDASAIDVGEMVSDRSRVPFVSSLAAGFDAAVGERAQNGPKWLGGLPRYLWATLAEVASLRNWNLRVTVDGRVRHDGPALFASVLNTPSYGSGMPIVPHAQVTDARLDVIIAGRFGRLGTLLMLPRLLAGRHLGHPRVGTRAFAELRVECTDDVPLAADGEPLPPARSFDVRVRPAALRVVTGPVP